jgi:hypothetical protein
MSGESGSLRVGPSPTPTHPLAPPEPADGDSGLPGHRRAGPDDPRCLCGRSREACVRDAVRAVWTARAPAEEIGPELEPVVS